jgi:hypothetical protein
MTRKICALLQKKPEPTFAMDKAPKAKKPKMEKVVKPVAKKEPK